MPGPFIDPSILLLDPQFTDRFDVVQRVQVVSNTGHVSTNNTVVPNVLGVVTPANPSELQRYDDKQFGHRTLWIATRFKLNDAARSLGGNPPMQRQPDQLLWNGDTFTVVLIMPWTRYGPGWTRVLVTSVDSVEVTTQGYPHA